MSENPIEDFKNEREKLNQIVMKYAGITTKRFFNLDEQVYATGALPQKMKELMGLVASFTLRCDDCVLYHLVQCHELGVTDQELEEALAIGLVVGGSNTIPHLRRAFKFWEELGEDRTSKKGKRA
jgi:AhpD family alkylhydroperoxidase